MPPFFPLNCTTISAYFGDPFELNWIDILHFQILLFSFFFSWYLFWWQLNNSLHSHLPFPQLQNQLGHLKLKEIDRQISFSWPQIAISSSAHLNRLNIHPYHHFDSFKYPKISFLPSSYLEDTQIFFFWLSLRKSAILQISNGGGIQFSSQTHIPLQLQLDNLPWMACSNHFSYINIDIYIGCMYILSIYIRWIYAYIHIFYNLE